MSSASSPVQDLLGSSAEMERVRAFVLRAAEVDVPVLFTGETGTGKSLAARILHGASVRREKPFLAVNCAGVPEGLFESELFGHERGAFTGASQRRKGLFEAAAGGTIFLDEVGDLPVSQQAKLLTVLEDGQVRRVGSVESLSVNVRVVSGTGRDLEIALERGAFRRDLYHRLAVLTCHIPPLRERPGDALALARRWLRRVGRRYGRATTLAPEAVAFIEAHPWPGNVRELYHALQAAVILEDADAVDARTLRTAVGVGRSDAA